MNVFDFLNLGNLASIHFVKVKGLDTNFHILLHDEHSFYIFVNNQKYDIVQQSD